MADLLAVNIQSKRKALGLSQAELAKLSGLSQQRLSQLESGKQLSTKKLPSLARALQCDISELDPQYSTLAIVDLPERDKADVLLAQVSELLARRLGFKPNAEQVVRHLLSTSEYRHLNSQS